MSLLISAVICLLLCSLYSSLHQKVFASSICYLFVGLGEQDAHTLHRQAAVAQRTGVAAVTRGRVHALHSGETRVKLALQGKKEDTSAVEAAKCMWVSQGLFTEKLLGLMTLLLMQKRECWRGESSEKGSVQTRKDRRANAARNTPSSFYPHEDVSQTLTAAETLTFTCGFYCWASLKHISFCEVRVDPVGHSDGPIARFNFSCPRKPGEKCSFSRSFFESGKTQL